MQNTSLVKMTEVSKTPIFVLYHVFFKFWTFKSIVNVFIYYLHVNKHHLEFFNLFFLGGGGTNSQ